MENKKEKSISHYKSKDMDELMHS